MGLREEKQRRLREQIRDTAIRLFRERGIEETRIRDIASAVGVSEATFYNYYPTKDHLLEEHAEVYLDAYQALLEYELTAATTPVPARLREIAELLAVSFEQDKAFNAATVSRTSLLVGASGLRRDRSLASYASLAALFRVGKERGEIRVDADEQQLAEVFTGICILTITNWLVDWWPGESQPLPARISSAVDIFLAGASQPPGP